LLAFVIRTAGEKHQAAALKFQNPFNLFTQFLLGHINPKYGRRIIKVLNYTS